MAIYDGYPNSNVPNFSEEYLIIKLAVHK